MIKIWQIGNTGVRNPLRIQDALRVYSESNIVGKIRTVSGAKQLMLLLHSKGVLKNQAGKDGTGSYGRKWRLLFNKNGFTYDEVDKSEPFTQDDIGFVDTLTPFGKTFLEASTVPAVQECFLRSMSMMMEPLDSGKSFSPLRWTLAVMLATEKRTGDSDISFIEFATQVQTSNPEMDIEKIVDSILKIRDGRNASLSKRKYDKQLFEKLGCNYKGSPKNFSEYGDMNLRYLKATGIVKSRGKGIAIVDEKHELAKRLAADLLTDEPKLSRLKKVYSCPSLPTDDKSVALVVLRELENKLQAKRLGYKINKAKFRNTADINNARRELEDILRNNEEEIYAKDQKNRWKEIADYMELVVKHGGTKTYPDDTKINVPSDETPAYLEWCLWRAFLAMNTLKNKPYEVRKFNVDQDFMPVGTAPGNGPDLIAEYGDCTVVIEVTMSENSRQEAMEGEPVRRHVSDVCAKYGKPTYGLFIANHVDTNTAETFRTGTWYIQGDVKTRLDIVPMTLRQFKNYFISIFTSGGHLNGEIIGMLKMCMADRDLCDAPEWKRRISNKLKTRPCLGVSSDINRITETI